ncbi:hypothetical protein ACFYY2_12190 [Streptomyces sp. NPDC001822]|uniref:hypothetical protein n=1 Tax=Streptomyces sp. NPDC001822 TaxID=3364614 RepID=UPI0036AB5CE9
MAEISYPFNADNATTGAAKAVSEAQWQKMAHMWGSDRVDLQLGFGAQSAGNLPFPGSVVNVTTVQVGVGKAWVGGFYYELTAAKTVSITANSGSTGRKDLIVLRLDMSKPGVNLAVRAGVAAASPLVPMPVRGVGGITELPLYEVSVPANGGAISLIGRAPYDMPSAVGFPWNAGESALLLPAGTFSYDMDSNVDGVRNERYNDREAVVATRTMGPPGPYLPALLNDSDLPNSFIDAASSGQWRWIAPNTVSFAISINNPLGTTFQTDGGVAYGIRLPVPAHATMRQVFHGVLNNPVTFNGIPGFTTLTGFSGTGASNTFMSIYMPSATNPASGLDNFKTLPPKATLTFSGTYEANIF